MGVFTRASTGGGIGDGQNRETEESVDQSSASVFVECSDLHLQKKTHAFSDRRPT